MSRRDQEMAAIQALPVPLSAKCCPQTQTADIGPASASACSSGFLLIGFEHPLTPSLIQSPHHPRSERALDLRLTLSGWTGRTAGSALSDVTLKFRGLTNSGPPFTSILYQSMIKFMFYLFEHGPLCSSSPPKMTFPRLSPDPLFVTGNAITCPSRAARSHKKPTALISHDIY